LLPRYSPTIPIKESKTYLAAARFAGAMPSVVETAVLLFGGEGGSFGMFCVSGFVLRSLWVSDSGGDFTWRFMGSYKWG